MTMMDRLVPLSWIGLLFAMAWLFVGFWWMLVAVAFAALGDMLWRCVGKDDPAREYQMLFALQVLPFVGLALVARFGW